MSSRLNPYLTFDGNARQAMEFYAYWDELSAGGTVQMPLGRQVWGDEFGMCVDRFGVSWMVNVTRP